MKTSGSSLLVAVGWFLSGCAFRAPANPSFSLSLDEAKREWARMASQPKKLARPLVVLTGYLDPGVGSWWVSRQMRMVLDDPRMLTVAFFTCADFDACRRRLLERVENAFPSASQRWTTEVDIVAISMGGLVARYAAAPPRCPDESPRRLKIARLFTISSPHRGAQLAEIPCFLPLHIEMRSNSRFLAYLGSKAAKATYSVYPYVRLGDQIVGARLAAPAGAVPWWVGDVWPEPSHAFAANDARILADIARRLRGESPYTSPPPAPLPEISN